MIGVGDKKKNEFYEGENTYNNLFVFINPFAETFFRVGEDKTRASETTKADKPWLSEVKLYTIKFNSNLNIRNSLSSIKNLLTTYASN